MRHSNPSMNRYHYTVEEFLMNALLVRDLYRLEWGGGGFLGVGVAWFSGRMEEDQSSLV